MTHKIICERCEDTGILEEVCETCNGLGARWYRESCPNCKGTGINYDHCPCKSQEPNEQRTEDHETK